MRFVLVHGGFHGAWCKGDVLVGHSGGGFDISYAAGLIPDLPSFMIYLAAGLPLEGKTTLEATGGTTPEDADYGSEPTARWAFGQLTPVLGRPDPPGLHLVPGRPGPAARQLLVRATTTTPTGPLKAT